MNVAINGKRVLAECQAFPVLEYATNVDELNPPLWRSHIGYVGKIMHIPEKEFIEMEHVKVKVQSGKKIREFFAVLIEIAVNTRTRQLSLTFK